MATPNHQMQMILDAHAAMGGLPIEALSPEQARLMPLPDRAAVDVYGHHISKKAFAPMPPHVGAVSHVLIPSETERLVARVYTPKGDAPKEGWPVLLYFHGGGWVIATLDTYDTSCRALCIATDCMVVSVHYRQAPENPWPAAANDAFQSYEWLRQHACGFGGDANRIAIAGESAGGNLAAVTTLMARDKGVPLPVHQLLVYPVTDIAHGPTTASAKEHAAAKPLNTPMLHWFYKHYAPSDADHKQPYVSPLHGDLKGLPPATVILAEIDPLRSEGEMYAKKLSDAGVPVTLKLYEGVTHEFFGLAGLVNEAGEAVALAAKNLRKAFGNEQSFIEKTLDKAS